MPVRGAGFALGWQEGATGLGYSWNTATVCTRDWACKRRLSAAGRMALMRTVSPAVFVAFKRWMAELDNRPAGMRRRDKLQADIVQQMLDEKALQP